MSPAPALAALLGAHDSAAWSPASLPGIVEWHDASDTSTITESGGLVSQWADKSGNGNHLTQSVSGSKPTTGADTQNGLNVLTFDGARKLVSTGSTLLSSTAMTAYLVSRGDTGATEASLSAQHNSDGDWNTSTGFQYSIRTDGVYYESSRKLGPFGRSFDSLHHLITIQRNGASWVGRKDGAQVCTGSTGTTAFNVNNLGLGGALIGQIASFILCSSFHGSSDLAAAEGFLMTKWGL